MDINKKTVASFATVFILGIIIGVFAEYNLQTSPLKTELSALKSQSKQDLPPVVVQGETKTQTQVVYVPKETIKYVDTKTGQEVTTKESTDVQADIKQPSVNVKVNGKDYKFDLLQGETQKFENGKVVMNQTSDIGMNISIPTVDRTKNGAIGIGYGTNGPAVKLDIKNIWLYGDKDTKAGGIQYRF